MIYIDIDGVLADSDAYIFALEPRAKHDGHLLFKTIYRRCDEVFRYSEPLFDFSVLDNIGDFALLTALPLRVKIDSFSPDAATTRAVLDKLAENKRAWAAEHFPGRECEVVGCKHEKMQFCTGPSDILIDDSDTTRAQWLKRGGKAFASVEDFLKKYEGLDMAPDINKVDLW